MDALGSTEVLLPQWIEPSLVGQNGRDPLGLEAILTYRIMPDLLPGILELSRRARYYALFAFLLDWFQRNHGSGTQDDLFELTSFTEYSYGYACFLCEGCRSQPVGILGETRISEARRRSDQTVLEQRSSMDSSWGGYGQVYQSSMSLLGITRLAGSARPGAEALPTDRLRGRPGRRLAEVFGGRLASTRWAREYLGTTRPIPLDVLKELSAAGCLCGLSAATEEADLLLELLTSAPAGAPASFEADATARRQGLRHFLRCIERDPPAAVRARTWRQTLWNLGVPPVDDAAAAWGAAAGQVMQATALGPLWRDLGRVGLRLTAELPYGIPLRRFHEELRALADAPACLGIAAPGRDGRTRALAGRLAAEAGALSLNEAIQRAQQGGGLDAVGALLLLWHRLPDAVAAATWGQVADIDGDHQYGLTSFAREVTDHLEADPSVGDTVVWFVDRFLLTPHQRIAAGKLPESTFRFREEGGRLTFDAKRSFASGDGMLRHQPLSLLTRDLGLWEPDGADRGRLTARGERFLTETAPPP